MGDFRESILRQQLQKELSIAKRLESEGRIKEAGVHYIRAGSFYRRIASGYPQKRAEEMYSTANQYERLGSVIKSGEGIREVQELPETVKSDVIDSLIVTQKPDVDWNSIGGLDEAKRTIKEAIIIPFIKSKPPFVKAPRTILLYGPPGTGKTLLAKAAANTLNATFFEARLPALLSKYFGESPKLISALFLKAKEKQPSLIFMDELDAMAVSRDREASEASRRVLGQFLTEIDGFSSGKDDKIIIMGATNKPWDLDDAMISRFQRKIYIPLPDENARRRIFKIQLAGAQSAISPEDLAKKTEGWAGRDIASLCQEAIINMVRECNPNLEDLTGPQLERYTLVSRPLSQKDFDHSFERVKPATVPSDVKKFDDWQKDFGG